MLESAGLVSADESIEGRESDGTEADSISGKSSSREVEGVLLTNAVELVLGSGFSAESSLAPSSKRGIGSTGGSSRRRSDSPRSNPRGSNKKAF